MHFWHASCLFPHSELLLTWGMLCDRAKETNSWISTWPRGNAWTENVLNALQLASYRKSRNGLGSGNPSGNTKPLCSQAFRRSDDLSKIIRVTQATPSSLFPYQQSTVSPKTFIHRSHFTFLDKEAEVSNVQAAKDHQRAKHLVYKWDFFCSRVAHSMWWSRVVGQHYNLDTPYFIRNIL